MGVPYLGHVRRGYHFSARFVAEYIVRWFHCSRCLWVRGKKRGTRAWAGSANGEFLSLVAKGASFDQSGNVGGYPGWAILLIR
jgi:hypothetical protein